MKLTLLLLLSNHSNMPDLIRSLVVGIITSKLDLEAMFNF